MDTYQTTDLGLVAFLRCKGFKVINLVQQQSKTAFVLEDHPSRKQRVMDYFNGAELSCIDFLGSLQEAKTLMRQI